jgi:hypothetical protein
MFAMKVTAALCIWGILILFAMALCNRAGRDKESYSESGQ